ncbi:MAG TPA: HemK2/MTQ2 family protein methyltransferase [Pseudonocardia sp.]
MLLRPPGVYRAQDDTKMLIEAMCRSGRVRGASVLDVGTGCGALAVAAAQAGASRVTAIDISLRSVMATRANAALNGVSIRALRGDLFTPVRGELFDLVVTNPPYVPGPRTRPRRHHISRCWDAGPDGRLLLDRICDAVPGSLAPGGVLMLVQSELTGEVATLDRLSRAGLDASVTSRARIPFGPVLRGRDQFLREHGVLPPDQLDEEIVVIEAYATDTTAYRQRQ